MTCCHTDFALAEDSDKAFTLGMPTFTFGAGCLAEAGDQAKDLGLRRVALFTDRTLRDSEHVTTVLTALAALRSHRRRGLRRSEGRADRRFVPRRGAIRRRGALRRLRLGGRRLGDRHLQGGQLVRDASRGVSRLRQRADRRRKARARRAETAYRLPDHLRHGVGVHRHRRVRSPRSTSRPASRRNACAPRSPSSTRPPPTPAEKRGRGKRLRLHQPRPGILTARAWPRRRNPARGAERPIAKAPTRCPTRWPPRRCARSGNTSCAQ